MRESIKKASKGFTLLEAVIALSVWMILSVSVIFIWRFTSERTEALIARQNALENARMAMDVLTVNLQMARNIDLYTVSDYTLRRVVAWQLTPDGRTWNNYIFDYNRPGTTVRNHLLLGGNEFARYIAHIRMEPIGNSRMHIRIVTECECTVIPVTLEDCDCLEPPIILESSVGIRHKALTVNGRPR